jgi:PQ loop repeat protein
MIDRARIPQIIKNQKEKSCEGLSLLFFILSLLGNATYGAGVSNDVRLCTILMSV